MKMLRLLLVSAVVALSSAMTPWPLPKEFSNGTSTLMLSPNFHFECSADAHCAPSACAAPVIQDAFTRFESMIRPSSAEGNDLDTVSVCITTSDLELGPKTNESYSLTISSNGAIEAASVYGALYAMQSLFQLVETTTSSGKIVSAEITNAPVSIVDSPRFSYRGLLVDSGRHFLPVSFLKRVIDGLAMSKLNVLHWHIVDRQSFACGSDKFPQLAEKGAFSYPVAAYSVADMRALVQYGISRGVRIMPEWDIPGHGAWGMGMPDLMACSDVLDPTKDSVYSFLVEFLSEMATIFVDEYFFLGGDEVDVSCWDANPSVAAWLKQHNMTSAELQQYFWTQVTNRVLQQIPNKTISIWEADNMQIDPGTLPVGSVANVYQSKETANRTIGEYHMPTVLSIAGDQWYLDSQCPGYNWKSWECRYVTEPSTPVTAGSPLLLGGESAMWGEGINKDNFDAYVWHGAAAVAERLWSVAADTQELHPARWRMSEHMCRMSKQGFRPGPIMPGYCASDSDNV